MWIRRSLIVAVLAAGLAAPVAAAVALDDDGKLKVSGDFRFRLEHDWDSLRSNGTEREDRFRARVRARLGLTYQPNETLTFGMRLRSGAEGSQQSPHITIGDFEDEDDTNDADFNLDKWYLRAKKGGLWGWAGRNSNPIWKPNELFWDDDVTLAGIAFGWGGDVGASSNLALNAAFTSLPVGMKTFTGEMGLGQLVLKTKTSGGTGFTFAVGGFTIEADLDDPNATELRRGNGLRDYMIWVGNFQTKLADVGGKPLSLGVDYMTNSESYDPNDPDPVTAANFDETEGYDAYISWGGNSQKGDWRLALWWAHIETFSVHASYAQDDWFRWGSPTQTDSSDFEGFELRFGYGLEANQSLIARLYLVEAITSVQDGNRFRIDYNFKF